MEEFLEKLLSQIRCKKARPYIKDEIRMHIEDQISDNIRSGMSKEEAEREAIKDMGDPVEVGISLDRIHKPQISWKVLSIIAIISIMAIILQLSISNQMKQYGITAKSDALMAASSGFAIRVLGGLAVMFILYLIDYTTVAKYSRIIGSIMIFVAIIGGIFAINIAGRESLRVQLTALMMFYIPIYGAIIYKYRGGGLKSLIRAILWMVVPVFIVFRFISILAAGIMFISMLVQLTIALGKGWFKLPAKKTIILMWIISVSLPVVTFLIMYSAHYFKEYQVERLKAFFLATDGRAWITQTLRDLCKDAALFGNSGKEVIGYLPDFNRDYIFSYVLNAYGIIAGLLLIAVLAVFIICIFSTAINQKNQLGCVMGCGCGMILLMNMVINLLGCFGLILPTSSFLPFFSAGGSNIILSYALVGIILSIYRYKSVYPQYVSTKLVKRKVSIE